MTNGNFLFLQKLIYHARWINLLIVGLTQYIIIFLLFNTNASKNTDFDISSIYQLLVACTITITLGGYFINDYFDYKIDEINKHPKYRFEKPVLLQAYFLLNIIGFGLALVIVNLIDQYIFLLIYIAAITLLFLYASHFKKQGLIGNFIVSIFSSLVIALLWFVQDHFQNQVSDYQKNLLLFFMSFIFLASMARELVKDCQDIKGDSQFNLKTLPINIGKEKTNVFIGLFLITLLIVCSSWLYWIFPFSGILVKISLIPILILNLVLIYKNKSAKSTADYAQTSMLIKVLMGFGLISLTLISYQS